MDQSRSFFLVLFTVVSMVAMAQRPFLTKYEGHLKYTYKTDGPWSFLVRTGGLHTIAESPFDETSQSVTDRVEARASAIYNIPSAGKIAVTYMYRITTPFEDVSSYEHRLSESYSFNFDLVGRSFKNRVQLDQRMKESSYENRLRYRLGLEFPFSGPEVEPGEAYWEISDEEVFSFNGSEQALENRMYAGVGWFLDNKDKFEIGLEFRLAGPGKNEPVNALHFITTYNFSN